MLNRVRQELACHAWTSLSDQIFISDHHITAYHIIISDHHITAYCVWPNSFFILFNRQSHYSLFKHAGASKGYNDTNKAKNAGHVILISEALTYYHFLMQWHLTFCHRMSHSKVIRLTSSADLAFLQFITYLIYAWKMRVKTKPVEMTQTKDKELLTIDMVTM